MLKNVFLLFFCLTLGKLQANESDFSQDNCPNGRYQISTAFNGSRIEIYLLDTQNGKVWMTTSKAFGYYHSWSPLPLLPVAE